MRRSFPLEDGWWALIAHPGQYCALECKAAQGDIEDFHYAYDQTTGEYSVRFRAPKAVEGSILHLILLLNFHDDPATDEEDLETDWKRSKGRFISWVP